ncbi:hypothetical protein [Methanococcus maripaludis]|uniref:Uncharacterized protein n=1 Tax=Methanococcus maripaludis TaxID=39152 RepID=A0A7J9SET4_METMI|nr:hypothetical protein [Methanococcus maripaludis]MBB6497792.1 hypothetical protein [Methanococcus maripaludis]
MELTEVNITELGKYGTLKMSPSFHINFPKVLREYGEFLKGYECVKLNKEVKIELGPLNTGI